tara:strand:+ start:148 stop:576 length:429 start_codon:yes stop_codon:yes gene_type:complete
MNINELINLFKLYPDIFPSGYFRFLKKTLIEKINSNQLIYKDGVLLTWTKYKKKTKISPNITINKEEIKINQLINKNQGNKMAKKIFTDFLKTHKTNMYLIVKKDNKRAINFYIKNKFYKIGEKIMGNNIICFIMKRNIDHN